MRRRTSVALRYDSRLPAPLVVARGKGELAERLLAIAEQHSIPIVDSGELAESLYAVDPGELVPESFYETVAEVLGFVWRLHLSSGGETKKGVG